MFIASNSILIAYPKVNIICVVNILIGVQLH